MGDFDDMINYNFIWTQWKNNKIIDGLKTFKDFIKETKENESDTVGENSLASTFATDKESGSSTENLIATPKL